jgi:hypothetical protein
VTVIFGKQPPLKFADLNGRFGLEKTDLNQTTFDFIVTASSENEASFGEDLFHGEKLEDHDTLPELTDTGEIVGLYKVVPANDILIFDVSSTSASSTADSEICSISTEVSQQELSFEASLKAVEDDENDDAEEDAEEEEAEDEEEDDDDDADEEDSSTFTKTWAQKSFSLFDEDTGELYLADSGVEVESDVSEDGDRIAYVSVEKDANHYGINAHCFKRPAGLGQALSKHPKLACLGQIIGETEDGEWGVVGSIRFRFGRSDEGYVITRAEAIDNDGTVMFHLRTLNVGDSASDIFSYNEEVDDGELESADRVTIAVAQVLTETDYEDDLSEPTNPTGHGIAKLAIKAPVLADVIGKRAFGVNGIIQIVDEDVDLESILTQGQE